MNALSDLTLLYVEDNLDTAEQMLEILKTLSAQVFHAKNGKEAIEIYSRIHADMVISDIQMPLINGIELSRALREKDSDLCIILMSGFDDPECFRSAIDIGVNAYISKPIDLTSFIDRLEIEADRIIHRGATKDAKHLVDEYLKAFDSSVIFSKTDIKGRITYANDAFITISGYSREELLGKPHSIIRHPDTPKESFKHMWQTIQNAQVWKGVIKNRRKDGTNYTVESTVIPILKRDGSILEYMAIRYDITDMTQHTLNLQDAARKNEAIALQRSQELMLHLYIDDSTNLPNSLALQRDLLSYLDGSLFLLDINNFNIFNKLHGFVYGDEMLQEIAKYLTLLLDANETLYKLSADRFVVLSKRSETAYIDHLCNQIFAFFDNTQIEVDTIENLISFSIGIAKIDEGRDAIIDAEFALDISKRHGKRFKIIYNKESEEFTQERESIDWLNRTRRFIYQDMVVPFYQPIVDVHTRKVYKYEALARVIDGDELIPPQQFLNSAERLGLMTSITKSMIEKTFKQFSGTATRFSINITERDIIDGYLVEFIKHKLKKYEINPSYVTFEVLENLTLAQEGDLVSSTIALVKDYGCNIAIDDFGSENSNFGRILSLQSDYLKIDGLFIKDCDTDEEKQKIIDAIVQLAKRLKIKTIAEYVSSEAIFEVVKEIGVDYAQGFLFGKAEQFPQDRI
ncbi:MAG: EAL domain-containing protein [Campylobacterota bacterium]|nr:EAL domain-containing protein [Campylobacterota bacterium]